MTIALATDAAPLACPRCGAPFARDDYLALHLGRRHESLSPQERARFERAVAEEEAWLAAFRKHVNAGMSAMPIALVWIGILLLIGLSGLPVLWGFLLLPAALVFGGLVYYVQYTR